ncbi:hypothetical protein JCM10296v2_001274 [Rhodotorula toruloides]
MAKEYKLSQNAMLSWRYEYGSLAMQPVDIIEDDFPLRLRLGYDTAASAYTLSWANTAGLVSIAEAELVVCPLGSESVLLRTKFAGEYLAEGQGASMDAAFIGGNRIGKDAHITVKATLTATMSGVPNSLSKEREIAAEHAYRYLGQQAPNDVAFVFPREKKVLWACEASLVAASPYFKTLLESPFAEGALSTSFDGAFGLDEALPGVPFDDSDDEGANTSQAISPHNHSVKAPFKLVKITNTCYKTYAAVLVWLSSRYVRFVKVKSTSDAAANAAAGRELSFANDDQGTLTEGPPPPASSSPKSIYRLAHLLSLDELATLALENLDSQLTSDNAAYELYLETASCYPALRDIVLAYVVKSWDQVATSEGWAQMEERAAQGELPATSAQTAMLLARQLRQAR